MEEEGEKMRGMVMFLLILCFLGIGKCYGEERKRVSLYLKNAPLVQVFDVLEDLGINFYVIEEQSYQGEVISVGSGVSSSISGGLSGGIGGNFTNSSVQGVRERGRSSFDDIFITLKIQDVMVDELMGIVCRSANIYCEKTGNNTYVISRKQVYVVDLGVVLDKYSYTKILGLRGQGGSIQGGSIQGGGVQGIGVQGVGVQGTGVTGGRSSIVGSSSNFFGIEEDVLNFIQTVSKVLLTPEHKVYYSKRGNLVVVDRPSGVERFAKFIEKEKEKSKATKVNIKLIRFQASDDLKTGINVDNIISLLWDKKMYTINLGIGEGLATNRGLSLRVIRDDDKINTLIQLLSEYGTARVEREWVSFARAGFPVVLTDLRSIPYLVEQVVPLQGGGVGGTQPTQPITTVVTQPNFVDVGLELMLIGNQIEAGGQKYFEGQIIISISDATLINLGTQEAPRLLPEVRDSSVIIPISIKEGEALLISGLSSNEIRERTSGVPILSKLPVLKYLFSSQEKVKSKVDFLIFVEPKF